MGIAGQAEQRVQDELHGAGEDQADDQEQDRDLEQMADKRDRAEGQRRDRPYRVVTGDVGDVADRSAELAQPLHVTSPRSARSEEHTSELQSLMRNSYAVFCLKKKKMMNHAKNRRT